MDFIQGHWRTGSSLSLTASITAVGNVGAGTDDLISYTMPANVLEKTGRTIRVTAWGQTANNANPKTVTLNFGGTAILTTALTISIAGFWRIQAEVIRTGEDTQDYISQPVQGATSLVDCEGGALTIDEDATIIIKCTGTVTDGGGGINNNDIVQDGLIVEVVNM